MKATPMSGRNVFRTLTVLFVLACAAPHASAQIPSNNQMGTKQQEQMFEMPDFKSGLSSDLTNIPSVMDGPIDPNYYVVGPSDIFYLAVWGPAPFAFTVPVTLEGELIVPTIGTVNVAHKTLAEAKNAITDKIRGSYKYGNISVSLLQARQFTVVLKGAVIQPGQYIASSVDRVDRIVRKGAEQGSFRPTVSLPITPMTPTNREKYRVPEIEGIGEFSDRASLRNIFVIHKNGDTSFVDIPKYHATGDSRYNPYLIDGDVIYVPFKELERSSFSVHGAVNNPGTFEYVPGDNLGDALNFAEGLRHGAASHVAIIRHSDGTSDSAMLSFGMDYTIRSGDHIFVDPASANTANSRVELYGEVFSPGTYPIVPGETTLRDILAQSGGITTDALPAGSAMFRKRDLLGDEAHPLLQLQEVIRTYPLVPADSMFFLLNNQVGMDPVNVNMREVLLGNDAKADVPLQDGDFIYIARDRKTVLVQGQVRFPGYIPVQPGADFEYYIEQAGGYTEYADESGTRIIKRATQSWMEPDEATIASGDVLWIPKEPVRDFAYYLSVVKDIGVLAGSLVTIGLIIVQIQQISNR